MDIKNNFAEDHIPCAPERDESIAGIRMSIHDRLLAAAACPSGEANLVTSFRIFRPVSIALVLPLLLLSPLVFVQDAKAPKEMVVSYLPEQLPHAAADAQQSSSVSSRGASSSVSIMHRPSRRVSSSSRKAVHEFSSSSLPGSKSVFRRFKERWELPSSSSVSSGPSRAQMLNAAGVYLTSGSTGRKQFFEDTIKDLGEAGGNALIFDVKGSAVYFHSTAELANKYGLVRPLYDLPEIIRYAHEQGIYVMGRLIAVKDDGITSKAPETLVRHPKSNVVLSYGWVDPSNQTALRYNREVICDLAKSGIDEINMDYIRFSTANFGALKVWSGQEKADKVYEFVKMAREAIDECGPSTKLGISAYAILGWNYPVNLETLGQDVIRFAPMLDVISPMAYPATFTSPEYYVPGKHPVSRMYWLVYRTLTGYQELLGPEQSQKLRPWIQGYGVTTQNMIDQMKAVSDAGVCGFQVWSAGNYYTPTYAALKSFKRQEHCALL